MRCGCGLSVTKPLPNHSVSVRIADLDHPHLDPVDVLRDGYLAPRAADVVRRRDVIGLEEQDAGALSAVFGSAVPNDARRSEDELGRLAGVRTDLEPKCVAVERDRGTMPATSMCRLTGATIVGAVTWRLASTRMPAWPEFGEWKPPPRTGDPT
jgi:hypothetical protein